jgi:hypothetical protein
MSEDEKTQRDLELEARNLKAKATNDSRSGVGTRVNVGQTRGKAPLIIEWEAFDDSQPATLPTSIQQFMDVTTVKDEPTLVSFLIGGYNDANYTAASDPLAEFVNPAWDDAVKMQFRLVVRNYSRGASVSLEDAVSLIKPGFEKQFGK